jgi:tRNA A-37 threonylcarbamoyl transferase component Bud32/ABC-type branched-subunit amino acid transport system substrate-binding protein
VDDCLSEDLVAGLVDGSLDDTRFVAVERHLSECAACLRLVAQVGRALTSDENAEVAADARPELVPGAFVGRYEILALLGAGGMGRVYAARDSTLDRKVALKLLHPGSTTIDLEARLLREAKAMARLSHPEVITIHDVGHHGQQLFIAMELVDGGTLRQWLAASPRTWREILAVYLRAGRGLARAHATGIIHRDFKPDNVLIGEDGRVRVTDFGLARTADASVTASELATAEASTSDVALTQTGALVGTPAYMAPEQLLGSPADARSDLYGFCVALYEALCGARPFVGPTLRALQEAKLAGAVPWKGERRVPQRVLRALSVGLRPDPKDRYESMVALLGALERAARRPRWPFPVAAVLIAATAAAVVGARARYSAHRPPVTATGCASNRACVEQNGGAPFVCRGSDRACVPIASEDCEAKFEPQDLESDDTVWLGAMFPTKGPVADEFGLMNMASVDFARSEIAQTTKAFDGPRAAQRVRRIALVACDDSVDPGRAARHLVDDLGVPAVLGFQSGQEVVNLAGSTFIARDVLTVATLSSSPLITRIPQPRAEPRLVWRTSSNLDTAADASARIVEDVLATRYSGGPVRVTLVRTDVAGAASFAERVFSTLHFNGKAAVDNAGNYAEIKVPTRDLTPDEISHLADQIAETKPSIVVIQGGYWIAAVVESVESRMASARRKPSYLCVLHSTKMFASFIGTNADRRRRVYTLASSSGSVANARFVLRYNDAHEAKVTRTMNGGASYDAFYLLAYATFARGREPVTGPALARAFGRLVGPGRSIAAGPSDIFDGLAALNRGESVNLDGTQTALDFDLSTGDEPSDFSLLCSGVDARGRATGEDMESGVVYEAAIRKLTGAIHCP